MDVRLSHSAEGVIIFLVNVLGVDLVLYRFAYALVHEPGFSDHDAGNFEQDVMGMIIVVLICGNKMPTRCNR